LSIHTRPVAAPQLILVFISDIGCRHTLINVLKNMGLLLVNDPIMHTR